MTSSTWKVLAAALVLAGAAGAGPARAQTEPTRDEIAAYRGLHKTAAEGDVEEVRRLADGGAALDARAARGRTPLHVAAFRGHGETCRVLIALGADSSLLDDELYDAVTIVAVRDDVPTLKALLGAGASAGLTTSIYHGTALIAASHLGHDEVVRQLIRAGAPLDHVNNLGWTALMEAVILGDGGRRHVETVRALVEAGADTAIPDRSGVTPLQQARKRGYAEIAALIERQRR